MRPAVVTLTTALLISAGCGGRELAGPLVGTWTYSSTYGDVRTIAVTFNADGTAVEVLTLGPVDLNPGAGCSGTPTLSGYTWTSDSATLTISGSPTCSGSITCREPMSCAFPIYQVMAPGLDPADGPVTQVAGACQYTLSSDSKTLTLDHCTQTITLPPYPVPVPAAPPTDQLASYTLTRSS